VPEFIDPVFATTSQKRSFSMIKNERSGLVFAKTGHQSGGAYRKIARMLANRRYLNPLKKL
jgi:hypothetical protein